MKTKILLICAFFIATFQAFCLDSDYANLTDVNIKIVENGIMFHETEVLLLDGSPANIVFHDKITEEPLSKIIVNSTKTNIKNKDAINIDIEYLIYESKKWVSKTKSKILNAAGVSGKLSLSSATNTIDVEITAYPRDNYLLKSDPRITNIELCDSQTRTKSDCCDSDCSDGSGRVMTCCGAISCSGCGTSCSPGDVHVF